MLLLHTSWPTTADMLDRLPREILVLIGEHLDQVHPDSVLDLACVNKHCFSVLTLLFYRSVKIYVEHLQSDQLAQDVSRYYQLLLQRVGGYGTVRRLIIVHGKKECEIGIRFPGQARTQEHLQLYRHRITRLERSGRDEDILEAYTYFPGSTTTTDIAHQPVRFWKPVADLISRLSSLVSIIYNSYTQFPPCLLDAIHQHQPSCRLYITRFNLWSLGPQGPEDEYKSALLSSSCLHGIGVHIQGSYGSRPSGREANMYIPQALRELVAGVIPHLKKLVLFQDPVPSDVNSQLPRSWIGFGQQPKARGSLDYLSIHDGDPTTEQQLKSWQEDTDLSALKILKMSSMGKEAFEYRAANCHFPILTQLDADLASHGYLSVNGNHFRAAKIFLLGQPALSVLCLSKWNSHVDMKAILKPHGSRLYELSLSPGAGSTVTLEDLKHIAKYCPLLEKLTIRIKRSKGDAQEVAIYKTIGAFPRLQHLNLDLDASDLMLLPTPNSLRKNLVTRSEPDFDAFDRQFCYEYFDYSSKRPREGRLHQWRIG